MNIEDIVGILLLFIFLGIPYLLLGYWALCSFKKKKIFKASIITTVLVPFIIIPGTYLGFLPGASIYWDYKMSTDLTGNSFLLGKPELEYNSSRSFNGDGYSIAVYKIERDFKNPREQFFTDFPQKPSVREHWNVKRWKKTPALPNEKEIIEFALMEHSKNKQLIAAKKIVKKYLTQSGNFYSYFYFKHGGYLGDVDLFIICPKEKRLISINHNT